MKVEQQRTFDIDGSLQEEFSEEAADEGRFSFSFSDFSRELPLSRCRRDRFDEVDDVGENNAHD